MRYYIPGLTVARHAAIVHTSAMVEDPFRNIPSAGHSAIPHTSAMIEDGTITLGDLADESKRWSELNRVKLPAPSVGDYITPISTAASSSTFVENFEDVTDWVYSEVDGNNVLSGYQSTAWVTQGTYSYLLDEADAMPAASTDYCQISKNIDFTDLTKIIFDARVHSGPWSPNGTASIRIAGTTVWSKPLETWTTYLNQEIDVSGFTGVQTMDIRMGDNFVTTRYGAKFFIDNMRDGRYADPNTIDDDTTTSWRPDPINEVGAWCRWDMGALKICGACRIYWGPTNRPSSYKIQVSEDGTTWIDVFDSAGVAPAEGWSEYTWAARYARYIRYINTHATGENQEIFEADYYSRIVDRVAAEHAHGSSIVPHLKGSNTIPSRPFEELRKAAPTLENLAKRLEILENLTL